MSHCNGETGWHLLSPSDSLGNQPEPAASEGYQGPVLLVLHDSVVRGQGSQDESNRSEQKTGTKVVYGVSLSDPYV